MFEEHAEQKEERAIKSIVCITKPKRGKLNQTHDETII